MINNFLITVTLFTSLTLSAQGTTGVEVDKIVARVDNYIILKSDLEILYQDYIMRGNSSSEEAKCKMLNRLVINKMMVAKADIDSVVVTDEEIDANTNRRMQMILQNSVSSPQELERMYGKTMEDIKMELRDRIREQMLSSKMASKITSDISATPSEVRSFFRNIPKDSLPFYSADVEVAQIVREARISQEQKNAAKKILIDIRNRILQGESFNKLAKKYSEDPSAQQNEGEMGYVGRGDMVGAYEAMVSQLKIGEISQPFESPFGFHILQLIDRRGNEYNSRHVLILAKPSSEDIERAKKFLSNLRTTILNDSISFVDAAKKYSDDKETKGQGGFFTKQVGSFKLSMQEIDPTIYFTIDTMRVGSISQPMFYRNQAGKEAMRIIYFKTKTLPHKANLKSDWHRIWEAAIAEKQNKALNKWFDTAKKDVFIKIEPEYKKCKIMQ